MKSLLFVLSTFLISVTVQSQVVKIGYANVDYILSQMPEAKTIEAELSVYEKERNCSEK